MLISNAASKAVFRAEKMGKADLVASEHLFAGLNAFEPGQGHELHTHAGQDKLYYVLEGAGDVTVGEKQSRIGAGDLVLARSGEKHALLNPGPGRLLVMVVMGPPPGK
ncbi:MAG: cupin domain-containing protein [Acidobacteria bacterium]|nr:cupin domain-containing protein [Acidobacteriota bacterium]